MKVARHIIDARREAIALMLSNNAYVPVAGICKQFNISEATARRDLTVLEAQQRLTRTHGGAHGDNHRNIPVGAIIQTQDNESIKRLSLKAATKIKSGMTIYLDAGPMVHSIAEAISAAPIPNIQVVTPSISIAQLLATLPGVKVHLLGGDYSADAASVAGARTLENVTKWNFDLAFLRAEAIDEDGLWHSNRDSSHLQREVLGRSHEVLLCLGKTKLGLRESFPVAREINKFFLVVDADVNLVSRSKVKIPADRILTA